MKSRLTINMLKSTQIGVFSCNYSLSKEIHSKYKPFHLSVKFFEMSQTIMNTGDLKLNFKFIKQISVITTALEMI